ncbi:myogenesis-regulating glycosidase isoform X2 [Athalia rosae]|uniref:myogenesis-regulating glycosidase isoform X2 n=1 Tax=Athalia rosae TaxID=37344 RepID=UPI002033C3DC|nr:myogenesis-regulating glycosidase isoform X2 [Athalia rosae]
MVPALTFMHELSMSLTKLLLSTADPWDVRVASVEPEGLAKRRGVVLPSLRTAESPNVPTSSHTLTRTPSPWYKPIHDSPAVQTSKHLQVDQGALTSPEWPLPWYKPLRSPTSESFRGSTQSVPLPKFSRIRANSYGKPLASTDHLEATISNDSGIVNVPVVQVRFEDENICTPSGNRVNNRDRNASHLAEVIVNKRKGERGKEEVKENGETQLLSSSAHNLPGIGWAKVLQELEEHENHPPAIARAGNRTSIGIIVEHLVEERYNSRTTRRLKRPYLRTSPVSKVRTNIDQRSTGKASTPKQFVRIKDTEESEELIKDSERKRNSRKTSASMPDKLNNMDELEKAIKHQGTSSRFSREESESSATFSNSGSTPRVSPLDSDTDDDVNEDEMAKMPLQASLQSRPTPIAPMSQGQKGNREMDIPGGQSVNSTITSVNSISSLLKERFQLALPQALRSSKKQQNADYRLKAFVGVLFLSIVFLVGFAHFYYNQHVLQRAYYERFRFNKNDRVMHVYGKNGAEIIAARLGEGIAAETGVFACLDFDQRSDSVCLEWLHQTRLYMSHTQQDDMHCYHVTWQSLNPNYNPKDCFDWSPKRGHWYGAGQTQNMAYPLEEGNSVLELSPFITGDIRKHSFGNVLKRYFLNSKGATILIDPETPLYVSMNANRTKDFCIQAKHDSFAYVNHLTPLPQLNYTVCASDNMKTLHSLMTEKSLWDGLNKEDADAVTSLLSEPVWQISPTDEAAVYNYTKAVITLGFLPGHVLLSEEWQPNTGDFHLDESRFATMEATINVIHRRGFRIVFSVQPFISTESVNFKEAVAERLLISERGSDPRIPALTRYKQSHSAAILDITNNRTLPWLQRKLQALLDKYKVNSFYLDIGNAYDMPHYYNCHKPLTNPDEYKTLFTQAILSFAPVTGVSGAISRPRAPVFVSLPPFPSSWKAIKTVIPTVLNYGIIGYPFIMPGAVGGDVALPMSDNNPDNDFEFNLPDKELYVRWLQLSTFLPVIRFTHLPSKYSDESVLEMAKSLASLRQKTVTPLLKKYASEALDSGLPIIRPLWMLDPSDPACHVVVDEFSVGEELIVAPILYSGSRQREVYLPAGVWREGIDGSLRKGSRWIHNYRVSEDKVAYFVKMPDNTRF